MLADLARALRALTRDRSYSVVSITSLAIGMAAAGVVGRFVLSVVRPDLPYPHASRLVEVAEPAALPEQYSQSRVVHRESLATLEEQDDLLEAAALHVYLAGAFTFPELGERAADGIIASHALFSVLGIEPIFGRGFRPEEDEPGRGLVALLGYELWERSFGGDSGVIGQVIRIAFGTGSPEPVEIIGVLPPATRFPPRVTLGIVIPLGNAMAARGQYFSAIARRRPAASVEQIRARLNQVRAARLAHEAEVARPIAGPSLGREPPRARVEVRRYRGEPLDGTSQMLLGLVVLGGAVVLVLAGANATMLLLVRLRARNRELAVHTALGASRARIFRVMGAEYVLLTFGGWVLGAVLAVLLAFALRNVLPGDPRLAWLTWRVDWRSLGTLGLVCSILMLLAGLVAISRRMIVLPAVILRAEGARLVSDVGARRRLVLLQVALSCVLLVAGGIFTLAFQRAVARSSVSAAEQIHVGTLAWAHGPPADRSDLLATQRRALDAIRSAAGVEAVAIGAFGVDAFLRRMWGSPSAAAAPDTFLARINFVSSEYFRAIGLPLESGRTFDPVNEERDAPVAVVSASLARRMWPDTRSPVGRELWLAIDSGVRNWQIVGIAHDLSIEAGIGGRPVHQIYLPAGWRPSAQAPVVVRMRPSAPAEGELEEAIPAATGGQVRLASLERLADALAARSSLVKFLALTFAALGAGGLLLAAMGLYGVLRLWVAQRDRELGIRTALGATPREIAVLILRQTTSIVGGGIALGVAVGWVIMKITDLSLFGSQGTGRWILGVVAIVVATAAVGASIGPIRRANRMSIATLLRSE